MARIAFETHGFSLIVCRHPETLKFLAVEETKNRGWWLPGGHVDEGQTFPEAAVRECQEEAGVDVVLKGVLSVQHSLTSAHSARMRIIYYAEPKDPNQPPKSVPDSESLRAAWMSVDELRALSNLPPPKGLRGDELLVWGAYIENGGLISPIGLLGSEYDSGVPQPKLRDVVDAGNHELARKMVLAGAAVNPSSPSAPNPLHHAVLRDDADMVGLLLLGGADPCISDQDGNNALHLAAGRGQPRIVRALLLAPHSCGASCALCDAVNSSGKRPGELVRQGDEATLALLRLHAAK